METQPDTNQAPIIRNRIATEGGGRFVSNSV